MKQNTHSYETMFLPCRMQRGYSAFIIREKSKMTTMSNMKKRIKVLTVVSACLLSVHCMADAVKRQAPVPFGASIAEEAQFPNADSDIMGFRLCLLYGRHANVSGLDIGVFGCAVDGCLFGLQTSVILNSVGSANGALQIGGIANNCIEDFYGVQLSGIANKVDGSVYGGQLSTFNIAQEVGGTQIGVYNKADKVIGVQIGVINWATDMLGVQLGVLNVIKNGPCQYLPILNANF